MSFNQTDKAAGTILTRRAQHGLQIAREVLETSPGVWPTLQVGAGVTVDATTGLFKLKTLAAEPLIGVVVVSNNTGNNQRATIQTTFIAEINRATAAGAIPQGTLVRYAGTNGTNGLPQFAAAASGVMADGIVLTSISGANAEGVVYIFAAPVQAP